MSGRMSDWSSSAFNGLCQWGERAPGPQNVYRHASSMLFLPRLVCAMHIYRLDEPPRCRMVSRRQHEHPRWALRRFCTAGRRCFVLALDSGRGAALHNMLLAITARHRLPPVFYYVAAHFRQKVISVIVPRVLGTQNNS